MRLFVSPDKRLNEVTFTPEQLENYLSAVSNC